jgi:hypothetical protein
MTEDQVDVYVAKKMTGRCRSGGDYSGRISHAVPIGGHDWAKAVCGVKPGDRGNGWSEDKPKTLTCPKCLARLHARGQKNGKMPRVLTATAF